MQQEKEAQAVPTPKGNSEAAALVDIVEWSKGCAAWQRGQLHS